MKKNLKKVAYLCLVSVITLTASLSYASVLRASEVNFSTISPTEGSKEADKLINNVKVFYNPISEQISLSFKMGKQNTVTIKVMDALGNEVLQLMNGTLDAGNQNLSFDPSGKLTSGFYFIRVVSGSETVVKRFSIR